MNDADNFLDNFESFLDEMNRLDEIDRKERKDIKLQSFNDFLKNNPECKDHILDCKLTMFVLRQIDQYHADICDLIEGHFTAEDIKAKYIRS